MKILHASFLDSQGHVYLEFETDKGTAYCDSPKLLFLANGFIPLWGPDVEEGRVESEPCKLPPAPADGMWEGLEIQHATRDLIALHFAFQSMAGELAPGPLEVPTLEEVEKWKWEIRGGDVIKKLR